MGKRNYLVVDVIRCSHLGLNATLSMLASYLYSRIAAARDGGKSIGGLTYYPAKYEYASQHVPSLPAKTDTLRRLYKDLENVGLVKLLKIGNTIHFAPSPMLRSWGEDFDEEENTLFIPLTEKNPQGKAEKNPQKSGKKSANVTEKAEKNPQGAEKNPHTHIDIIKENNNNDANNRNDNNTPETSGDTLFADVVIEKEIFGLTPSQVGVTKKTFDNVTAKIQRLQFPTNADNEFKRKFVILACSPKWQKKTIPALQMNIKKLSEYDLDFASELIDKSIAGGWQGVIFSNTPEEYKKWKDSRFKQSDGQVNYDAIKEYLNNC